MSGHHHHKKAPTSAERVKLSSSALERLTRSNPGARNTKGKLDILGAGSVPDMSKFLEDTKSSFAQTNGQIAQLGLRMNDAFGRMQKKQKEIAEKTGVSKVELPPEAEEVVNNLKAEVATLKKSMKQMRMSGESHPVVSVAGKSKSKDLGEKDEEFTTTAEVAAATAPGAIQSMQQLTHMITATNNAVPAMTSLVQQLNSLKSDDRYPAGWNMGTAWSTVIDVDHYLDFRNQYYDACWGLAKADTLWLSREDEHVGIRHPTGPMADKMPSKPYPFELYRIVYHEPMRRLYAVGNRMLTMQNSAGALVWEPMILAFDVDSKTHALTLNQKWVDTAESAFDAVTQNWPGTGMSVMDVVVDPSDHAIYVLLNVLASDKPQVKNASFCGVFRVLHTGLFDENFDHTALPAWGNKNALSGRRLAFSPSQSVLYVAVKRLGSDTLVVAVDSNNGAVLANVAVPAFVSDLSLNSSGRLFATGFSFPNLAVKGSAAEAYSIDLQADGNLKVTETANLENDQWSRVTASAIAPSGQLLCVGNVFENGMDDRMQLSVWTVDGKSTEVFNWVHPDFPDASLLADQALVVGKYLVIGGLIRFAAFQSDSSEMFLMQLELEEKTGKVKSVVKHAHLPCTPDYYAHVRSIAATSGSRVFFQANMQVTKFQWGRQTMLGSFTI